MISLTCCFEKTQGAQTMHVKVSDRGGGGGVFFIGIGENRDL